MSPQPPGSPDSGKPGSHLRNRTPSVRLADFRSRLDTRQVEGELDAIFRESPEFGRNLADRLSPFLEIYESGDLILIGAGGEVAVFGDPANQQVVKLCGPPALDLGRICMLVCMPDTQSLSDEFLDLSHLLPASAQQSDSANAEKSVGRGFGYCLDGYRRIARARRLR